jgi:sec-independent protein translocase protein TatC
MTESPRGETSTQAKPNNDRDENDDASRMSFGDHLEELRACLIRGLIGVALAAVVCLVFGKDILSLICLPLWRVQFANGLTPHLQVLSPAALFTAYLKISFLSGLIVSMPWLLWQLWLFISAGLYAHERRFTRLFVPTTSGLFAVGVLFVYFIVLPLVLQFFVSFNRSFTLTDPSPSAFQRLLLARQPEIPSPVDQGDLFLIPLLASDPDQPRDGQAWVNAQTRRLMYKSPAGIWSMPFDVGPVRSPMQSEFAIDFYVSFVLMLALGFGLAFQTPVLVFFLAWTGIVSTEAMGRARRYVILACVIIGAVLTPPDVISQILLAGPMYVLFELGLVVARKFSNPSVHTSED